MSNSFVSVAKKLSTTALSQQSPARLSLDISPRYVQSPLRTYRSRNDPRIVSWHAGTPGVPEEDLDWGLLTSSDTVRRMGHIAVIEILSDRPPMFQLTSGRVLWVVRDGVSRHRVGVFGTTSSVVNKLGVLDVPLDLPKIVGIPLPNDRVLIVSRRLRTRSSEAFATSYLTTIAVRYR